MDPFERIPFPLRPVDELKPIVIEPVDLARCMDAECFWCEQPLVGPEPAEIVHDPLFDPDARSAEAGPELMHSDCAAERQHRRDVFERLIHDGTPAGRALAVLETLVERLDGGDAIILLPWGGEAEGLRQTLRIARGDRR